MGAPTRRRYDTEGNRIEPDRSSKNDELCDHVGSLRVGKWTCPLTGSLRARFRIESAAKMAAIKVGIIARYHPKTKNPRYDFEDDVFGRHDCDYVLPPFGPEAPRTHSPDATRIHYTSDPEHEEGEITCIPPRYGGSLTRCRSYAPKVKAGSIIGIAIDQGRITYNIDGWTQEFQWTEQQPQRVAFAVVLDGGFERRGKVAVTLLDAE